MKNAILITGASKRIGFYLVKKFLQDGYPVIAHYRTMSEELHTMTNPDVMKVQCDFFVEKDLSEFIATVKRVHSLRAIIHNASLYEKTSQDLVTSIKQYNDFFKIHMMVPYVISEQLRPVLQRNDGGYADIIHITDNYIKKPNPKVDLYCSTKAALSNLTLSLSKKYAPKIKVNEIAPGPILFSPNHSDSEKRAIIAKTLLKKEGGEESVYQAAHCIMCNNNMTGSVITIDGGWQLV